MRIIEMERKEYHVTTLEFSTNKTFIYSVIATSEKEAKNKMIASLENKSKRGDTVYDVCENNGIFMVG